LREKQIFNTHNFVISGNNIVTGTRRLPSNNIQEECSGEVLLKLDMIMFVLALDHFSRLS